jgi:uncharacterized protein YqiB (DUF1249 family)
VSFFPSSKVNNRKKYQPNLVSLMSLCANNYFLFLKIQADKTHLYQQRNFFINDHLAYTITVNEVTRYTSLITFEQKVLEQKVLKKKGFTHKNRQIMLYLIPCIRVCLFVCITMLAWLR